MTAAAPSCTVEFRVRYSETDQMGIVYHANYLPWCEIGRTELIRRLWKSYALVEREEGVPPRRHGRVAALPRIGALRRPGARDDDAGAGPLARRGLHLPGGAGGG
jgi:hypothetical protein